MKSQETVKTVESIDKLVEIEKQLEEIATAKYNELKKAAEPNGCTVVYEKLYFIEGTTDEIATMPTDKNYTLNFAVSCYDSEYDSPESADDDDRLYSAEFIPIYVKKVKNGYEISFYSDSLPYSKDNFVQTVDTFIEKLSNGGKEALYSYYNSTEPFDNSFRGKLVSWLFHLSPLKLTLLIAAVLLILAIIFGTLK